jgi:hypothetical protein
MDTTHPQELPAVVPATPTPAGSVAAPAGHFAAGPPAAGPHAQRSRSHSNSTTCLCSAMCKIT